MATQRGVFVLAWAQVEIDGERAAPPARIRVGSAFAWRGEALRVDGAMGPLDLGAREAAERRSRTAAGLRGLLWEAGLGPQPPEGDAWLRVTDGRSAWTLAFVGAGAGRRPLLVCEGPPPPAGRELWVTAHGDPPPDCLREGGGGVVCFTPGTLILTPGGLRAVEALREGDLVQTVDDGPAEILWMARRRVTGARLLVMPHLAPVRLRAGALGPFVPEPGLLVSPDHRVVLSGPRARELFRAEEVLVAARDLVDGRAVTVERPRGVAYIHLALPRHGILLANGVETESFHPASASLAALGGEDRARLLARVPEAASADRYGPFARRVLSAGEAAVLRAA